MAKARRDVVSHFMGANAVSAESAGAYAPDRHAQQRQFERLRDAGIIRAGDNGNYWIDVPRYEASTRSRRSRILIVVAVLVLIAFPLAMFAR